MTSPGQYGWWRRAAAGISAAAMVSLGLAFTAPAAGAAEPGPDTTVTVTSASAEAGLVVEIAGTGYVEQDLPTPTSDKGYAGVYAVLYDASVHDFAYINANTRTLIPAPAFAWAGNGTTPGTIVDGAWQKSITVEPADLGNLNPEGDYQVVIWAAHGTLSADTLVYQQPLDLTAEQWLALVPTDITTSTESSPPTSTDTTASSDETSGSDAAPSSDPASTSPLPTSTPAPQCREETVPGSPGTPQLSWGINSSFVTYVQGAIGNGTVTTAGGAAQTADGFTWGAGSGTLDSSGEGTVSFPGSVHFTAHDGVLDATLSNLRVTITGAGTGVLILDADSSDMSGADVSASDVTFANLTFSSLGADGGSATVTLTADGAKAFAGFYGAGQAMEPLTITIVGAQAATTVERCYDAAGNLVSVDGEATGSAGGPGALAETGIDTTGMSLLGGALAAAGILFLFVARRRTVLGRHS